MALFRICVGLVVVLNHLGTWWSGALDVVWMDLAHGGYRNFGDPPYQFDWVGGYSVEAVYGMLAANTVLGLCLMAGVGGAVLFRVIAFVVVQVHMGLADLNGYAGGSYDELILNWVWLLVLAGPSRTLSWECWRATGAWTSSRQVALWPRVVVMYQAMLMYGTTGWQKLSTHWVPGGDFSALYYIFQQPTWQRYDMGWAASVYPLTQVATAATWFWEVSAPIWFVAFVVSLSPSAPGTWRGWMNRWRVREAYAWVGLFFHLVVQLTMNIGPFSIASACLYCAVWHPEEWEGRFGWGGERRPPSGTDLEGHPL